MTHPMIEEAARAIDPNAFHPDPEKAHILCRPDSVAVRQKSARAAALIACRIAIKACKEDVMLEVPDFERAYQENKNKGNMESADRCGARVMVLKRAADRLRALCEQIGEA